MSRSVRIFSSKSRTKGVDITKSSTVGFNIQLTRNGQLGMSAEEILRVIDLAVLGKRELSLAVVHEGSDSEHLTSTFTISRSNERSVDLFNGLLQGNSYVFEASLLEEEMSGKGTRVTNTSHSTNLLP